MRVAPLGNISSLVLGSDGVISSNLLLDRSTRHRAFITHTSRSLALHSSRLASRSLAPVEAVRTQNSSNKLRILLLNPDKLQGDSCVSILPSHCVLQDYCRFGSTFEHKYFEFRRGLCIFFEEFHYTSLFKPQSIFIERFVHFIFKCFAIQVFWKWNRCRARQYASI